MNSSIVGLDHTLVGVHDLEAARKNWNRLGFHACPRGRHIGWGTANYCLMFPNDYIELLGIVDASKFTNNLDKFLEQGEGFLGLAFRSDDVEATAAFLQAQGLTVDGPKDLKRIIELPEGDALPAFKLVHPERGGVPGLSAFFCQHLTPDLVWQDSFLLHPNGAVAVAGVITLHDDPGSLAQPYGALLGQDKVAVCDGKVTVQAGDCLLTFATAQALSNGLYEGVLNLASTSSPTSLGMQIAVSDLQATASFLGGAGVPYLRRDDSLLVTPDEANGVLLEFLPNSRYQSNSGPETQSHRILNESSGS
ncbi:VOC family protein [Rhodovibrionaceae bacterium A322]